MSKYIGTPVVSLSTDTVDVTGDITTTDATPEVIIVNDTHEDTDGGREGKVTFKGQASGGEETTLAQIQASHDGTSDDEKGDLIFKTNDGSDGASPTEAMRIDSSQNVGIGTSSPDTPLHIEDGDVTIGNSTTTGDNKLIFKNTSATLAEIRAADTATGSGALLFTNNGSERMRITSDGKVGIGDTAPDNVLNVKESGLSGRGASNGNTSMTLEHATDTGIQFFSATQTQLRFGDAASTGAGSIIYAHGDDSLRLSANGSERMRITSDGAMFFCTDFNSTTAGVRLEVDGDSYFTADGNNGRVIYANRLGSNGNLLEFAKAGSTKGSLMVDTVHFGMGSVATGLYFYDGISAVIPAGTGNNFVNGKDNGLDLGGSSFRWDDVFATNGTIQTSDENEKQNIASLTSAEITAATAISKLFKTFKWKDKVAAKGDNARTHTGVVAQQVETAMSDAGLDAGNYAFFISTTWWETQTEVAAVEANEEKRIEAEDAYTRTDTYHTKDEAPEGATERNRKGIRYPELLSFIGAATEQRLTSIESRLTALEGE